MTVGQLQQPIEPAGRLYQTLLIARVRLKVYIKSLNVSPIELTVK